MTDQDLRDLYRLLYDVQATCDLAMTIVALKPEGSVTRESVAMLFDRFRGEMDEELSGHVERYCDHVTTWPHDATAEAACATAYNSIAHSLRLARAQLIQRGIDWREVRPVVPTANALF